MAASSSMFGVMTRKAEHPCLNIPSTEDASREIQNQHECVKYKEKYNDFSQCKLCEQKLTKKCVDNILL